MIAGHDRGTATVRFEKRFDIIEMRWRSLGESNPSFQIENLAS